MYNKNWKLTMHIINFTIEDDNFTSKNTNLDYVVRFNQRMVCVCVCGCVSTGYHGLKVNNFWIFLLSEGHFDFAL